MFILIEIRVLHDLVYAKTIIIFSEFIVHVKYCKSSTNTFLGKILFPLNYFGFVTIKSFKTNS